MLDLFQEVLPLALGYRACVLQSLQLLTKPPPALLNLAHCPSQKRQGPNAHSLSCCILHTARDVCVHSGAPAYRTTILPDCLLGAHGSNKGRWTGITTVKTCEEEEKHSRVLEAIRLGRGFDHNWQGS